MKFPVSPKLGKQAAAALAASKMVPVAAAEPAPPIPSHQVVGDSIYTGLSDLIAYGDNYLAPSVENYIRSVYHDELEVTGWHVSGFEHPGSVEITFTGKVPIKDAKYVAP